MMARPLRRPAQVSVTSDGVRLIADAGNNRIVSPGTRREAAESAPLERSSYTVDPKSDPDAIGNPGEQLTIPSMNPGAWRHCRRDGSQLPIPGTGGC